MKEAKKNEAVSITHEGTPLDQDDAGFSDRYLAVKGIIRNQQVETSVSSSSMLHSKLKNTKTKELLHELFNRFMVAFFLSFRSNDKVPKN